MKMFQFVFMKFVICFLENQIYNKAIFIKNDCTCTQLFILFILLWRSFRYWTILNTCCPINSVKTKLKNTGRKYSKIPDHILLQDYVPPQRVSIEISFSWCTVIPNINKSQNGQKLWNVKDTSDFSENSQTVKV